MTMLSLSDPDSSSEGTLESGERGVDKLVPDLDEEIDNAGVVTILGPILTLEAVVETVPLLSLPFLVIPLVPILPPKPTPNLVVIGDVGGETRAGTYGAGIVLDLFRVNLFFRNCVRVRGLTMGAWTSISRRSASSSWTSSS